MNYTMKDISTRILSKEVKNEIMEARERRGPFEKNTALRRMAPKPKGYTASKLVYWLLFFGVIGAMAYAYTHHIAY